MSARGEAEDASALRIDAPLAGPLAHQPDRPLRILERREARRLIPSR